MATISISGILSKKANGGSLSSTEIDYYTKELAEDNVNIAQIGAFLMAVFTRGMTTEEVTNLTAAMVSHSDKLRWNDQQWAKSVVDKHSTGGVGDKTSHILAPMIAACGGKVPMISGRGLGVTGGTIDKLESIDGYSASIGEERLKNMLNDSGFFIVGQTERLVPADQQLYNYRDVTGTVPSVPLITASILSKKLCEGLRVLVVDIKLGSGALFQNLDEVRELANSLITVGRKLDLKVVAVISWMDQPLGSCIGNALEMAEVFSILSGGSFQGRLRELVLTLGENMMKATELTTDRAKARVMMLEAVRDGRAQMAMRKMLVNQGVSSGVAEALCSPPPPDCIDPIDYYLGVMGKMANGKKSVKAPRSGYISDIDAGTIAQVVWRLGAGRNKPDDAIDHTVGIRLLKHVGDAVKSGEVWCIIYYKEKELDSKLEIMTHSAITVLEEAAETPNVIVEVIE
ncbi:thymidine phosphorylase [Echinococcus multilocularis]|uniref:Thymidine phosphorylase n=1 Tax=Echinococcus multilocularis TaxID=6211 RepID=A0A068Y394_ECHMU|nr:thymidine phosphorylase [Echinococcus multilocularis]